MNRPLSLAVALASIAPLVAAQAGTGGFRSGDLYLYTGVWTGISSFDGGIIRIDPLTGGTSVLHAPIGTVPGRQLMTYDSWRDRLIFFAAFTPNQSALYASDAAGNLQDLGFAGSQGGSHGLVCARGDGIVYFIEPGNDNQYTYLDAANQTHVLQNTAGTGPWLFSVFLGQVQSVVYVPKTNSLVLARWHFNDACPGIPSNVTAIHRIDLSADGSRVVSESCYWYDSHPTDWDGETRGLSLGPDGDPILVIGNGGGSSGPQGRIAHIDMETDTASTFATTNFFAQHRIVGGAYSRNIGKAAVHDSFGDHLRVYSEGEVGGGTVLSGGLSASSGSGEAASLVEVSPLNSPTGMTSTVGTISLSNGGTQPLDIDVGSGLSGAIYLALGSISGWAPGLQLGNGVQLSLNVDAYFDFVLANPNQVPLMNSFNVLDGQGQATVDFQIPAGSSPILTGAVLHHAAVVFGPGLSIDLATNAVPVELVP